MKTLLSLLTLAALACAPLARAGSLVDVSVIDRDNGQTLPAYERDGKLYVAGSPGHRYSVRIANRLGERVMAVLSVDGVNAVSGETANPEQSGYVLDAYQSTDVAGWRKSLSEVAQFNFTALENSYAARTGRANNVGVIGVAVFREKPAVRRERSVPEKISAAPSASRDSASPAPAPPPAPMPAPRLAGADSAKSASTATEPAQTASTATGAASSAPRADSLAYEKAEKRRSAQPEESLGTGHGARETSVVTYINFDRASTQPSEVVSVWYDSYRNLVARGVIDQPPHRNEPQAFPNAFVADPGR